MARQTKQSIIDQLESTLAERDARIEELEAELEELKAAQAQPAPQPKRAPAMTLEQQTEMAVKAQTAIQAVARPGIRVWVRPAAGGMFEFQHCPEGQTPRVRRELTADGLRQLYTTYQRNAAKAAKPAKPTPEAAASMSHLA